MAAEDRGPLLHARIGVMRALNRHVERAFNPDRKSIIGESASWRTIGEHGWPRPQSARIAVAFYFRRRHDVDDPTLPHHRR